MEAMSATAEAQRQRSVAEQRCLQAEEKLIRGQQSWFENLEKMREQMRTLAAENKSGKGGLRAMLWSKTQPKQAASMDDEFRVAQDYAAIFKSVVEPLELEIKLRRAADKDPGAAVLALQSAVAASARLRGDMEQQLLVLGSQKQALQSELDDVREQFGRERTAHADLQLTWQRANENFLTLNRDYEDRTTESRLVSAEVYGALTRSRSHYICIPHSCSPLSPFFFFLRKSRSVHSPRAHSLHLCCSFVFI